MSDHYYHVNGDLVAAAEARVSVRDRGFLYGDAAFETIRVYDGSIFEWEAHAERLSGSCECLDIDRRPSTGDLRRRIEETLAANGFDNAYVRLSITRGVQPGKLTPKPTTDPGVVIIVAALPPGGPGTPPVWDGPATAIVAETRRTPNEAIPARAKTHNYLNGILARLESREAGADEAIMLDGNGSIAEGATSNCFFVTDGVLRTPSLDGPVLPGITRSVVVDLARSLRLPIEQGTYDVTELLAADEAFLTNTTWEIRPLASVDGRPIGGGARTESLRSAFDDYVATAIGGTRS